MKKVLKLNNKGFVLVETLIATVFVVSIFSIVFLNLYPLIGEYENRENYDDVDSKYGAYWAKKIIEDRISQSFYNKFDQSDTEDTTSEVYFHIDNSCNLGVIDNGTKTDEQNLNRNENDCQKLFTKLGIKNAYVTTFNIENFRGIVNDSSNNTFSSEFKDYINYLPSYGKVISDVGARYRVIVEFEKTAETGVKTTYKYKTFANMEVKSNEED